VHSGKLAGCRNCRIRHYRTLGLSAPLGAATFTKALVRNNSYTLHRRLFKNVFVM